MLYLQLPTPEQPTMSTYQEPDYVNTYGELLTREQLARRIAEEGYDNWTYSDSLHLRTDGKIVKFHPFKEFLGDVETVNDFLYFLREHLEVALEDDEGVEMLFGVLLDLHARWPQTFTEN